LQNQEWRQFPEHGVLHHRRKQTETIRNYRERVRQCEELAEYAMGEQIREILIDEQDHQIALVTALGQERANSA
jgi:bacterioferritin (cytochrome b1)